MRHKRLALLIIFLISFVFMPRQVFAEAPVDNAELVAPAIKTKKEVKKPETKEAKKETKKEVKKAADIDLSSKTVSELRELAKEKEIKGYSTMKKSELLEALK